MESMKHCLSDVYKADNVINCMKGIFVQYHAGQINLDEVFHINNSTRSQRRCYKVT